MTVYWHYKNNRLTICNVQGRKRWTTLFTVFTLLVPYRRCAGQNFWLGWRNNPGFTRQWWRASRGNTIAGRVGLTFKRIRSLWSARANTGQGVTLASPADPYCVRLAMMKKDERSDIADSCAQGDECDYWRTAEELGLTNHSISWVELHWMSGTVVLGQAVPAEISFSLFLHPSPSHSCSCRVR